ncbi:unnamed protein product [Soboliphyme baturini]|uniref:Uncharacterized protein n=1 Tax=Soboliphyme baturini TaxID=241478 RepID=A0A183ICQ1_9BILA|nr:unnamed protein product [Soboliphyme baturini]
MRYNLYSSAVHHRVVASQDLVCRSTSASSVGPLWLWPSPLWIKIPSDTCDASDADESGSTPPRPDCHIIVVSDVRARVLQRPSMIAHGDR